MDDPSSVEDEREDIGRECDGFRSGTVEFSGS
jgi:hypothetical protein